MTADEESPTADSSDKAETASAASTPDSVSVPLQRSELPPRTRSALRPPSTEAEIKTANAMEQGVRWQRLSAIVQTIATVAAAAAAGAAVFAVASQSEGIAEQARFNQQAGRDERLGTAMGALAQRDPTAKVGGATLLVRNAEERILVAESVPALQAPSLSDSPEVAESRRRVRDAGATYTSVLDLMEIYLRDPTDATEPALGEGDPLLAPEIGYGFNQFKNLIDMGSRIEVLRDRHPWAQIRRPTVSLESAQLYGMQFTQTTLTAFDNGRNFTDVDLRVSNFRASDLSKVVLDGAFLRCADMRSIGASKTLFRETKLAGADLRGANLEGADLTGADLTDADLRGANLDRTVLTGAVTTRTLWDGSYSSPIGKELSDGTRGDYNARFSTCKKEQVRWGPPRNTDNAIMKQNAPRRELSLCQPDHALAIMRV